MIEYFQNFVLVNRIKLFDPCRHIQLLMERESILDLSKYLNSAVRVELSGGRKGMMYFCQILFYCFSQRNFERLRPIE